MRIAVVATCHSATASVRHESDPDPWPGCFCSHIRPAIDSVTVCTHFHELLHFADACHCQCTYVCSSQCALFVFELPNFELMGHGQHIFGSMTSYILTSRDATCHVLQPEVMVAVARNAHSFLKSFNSTGQVVTLWSPFSALMSRSSIRGARIWLSTCLRTYQLIRASALPRPSRHAVREPASSETFERPQSRCV